MFKFAPLAKKNPQMLVTLFERCMKRRGVKETDPFDWEKTEENNADHAGDAKGVNAAVPKSELIKKHKDIELTEVSGLQFAPNQNQ